MDDAGERPLAPSRLPAAPWCRRRRRGCGRSAAGRWCAQPRCGCGSSRPDGRAAKGRRNSRGRSRRWRRRGGGRPARAAVPGSSRPSLPASCGWMPTAQKISGRRSARAMPTGQPARLAAMWTMMRHAGGLRPLDHAGLVLGEARIVEVAVTVDDHAASGSTWRGKMPAGGGSAVPGGQGRCRGRRRSARLRAPPGGRAASPRPRA